jgi:hypothetical protein
MVNVVMPGLGDWGCGILSRVKIKHETGCVSMARCPSPSRSPNAS